MRRPSPGRSTSSCRCPITARAGGRPDAGTRSRSSDPLGLPAATRRSIARWPAMSKRLWTVVQVFFAAAALWVVGRAVVHYWGDVRRSLQTVTPSWGLILASGMLVLVAYVVLIQTWRIMLAG